MSFQESVIKANKMADIVAGMLGGVVNRDLPSFPQVQVHGIWINVGHYQCREKEGWVDFSFTMGCSNDPNEKKYFSHSFGFENVPFNNEEIIQVMYGYSGEVEVDWRPTETLPEDYYAL